MSILDEVQKIKDAKEAEKAERKRVEKENEKYRKLQIKLACEWLRGCLEGLAFVEDGSMFRLNFGDKHVYLHVKYHSSSLTYEEMGEVWTESLCVFIGRYNDCMTYFCKPHGEDFTARLAKYLHDHNLV